MSALSQLQQLLSDLFQLDLADLDFGLYRLLRLKRHEVEAFLTEQLPRRVEETFQSMAVEERAGLEEDVSRLAARIKEEIAEDALLPSGEVKPDYRDMKVKAARDLIATYEAKRQQLQSVQATEAQKAEVFNHLYTFFSRYYEAGDFIPRRRYGARETYAVPYNGEETFFHWANKDQHYVKTGEAFRDYAFTVDTLEGPCRVRFILTEASVPPGNTKGDTRYFFPLPDQATWDEEARTLRVPFHYRLPTEEESEKYGKNSRLQEAILQGALPKILEAVPDPALGAALSAIVEAKEDQAISLLLKRLRHFTRRNTTDYSIHRDLEGFLKRELEFYIKDQVLHLGDIEGDLEAKRRILRVIRQLAEEVITFLAQIENVEKCLFEKRKFVLRTDYLVPIKEVPRDLWKEVLANKVQIEAWKTLFATPTLSLKSPPPPFTKGGKGGISDKAEGVGGDVNERFLEDHPTLVVNTAHFGLDFKERLLAAFDDLDGATDGLLIHAENYQALRFLERKYASQVKCIYIDPPYNTGSDDFIYKDRYRHSTWLAMMEERLRLARELMTEDGAIFVHIDENEQFHLRIMLEKIFGGQNYLAPLIWISRAGKGGTVAKMQIAHEHVEAAAKNTEKVSLKPIEKVVKGGPYSDEKGYYRRELLRQWGQGMRKEDRPSMYFPIPTPFGIGVYPKLPDGSPGRWRFGKEKVMEMLQKGDLDFVKDEATGEITVYRKLREGQKTVTVPDNLLDDVGTSADGTKEIQSLFGAKVYPTCKPTKLGERLIELVSWRSEGRAFTLDFFAGSGTTGHAVINLNREDGGRRRFILVEMADYFDTVLLPRIQKVMYAPEWKDGKPRRLPTKEEVERTPRLVKVLRLEGYEDALQNLTTEETLKREEPRARAHKERLGPEAYRLSYLVRLPLEASASMLNLAALEHPFRYTLEVLTEDGPRFETVDLVETFNFLYGLHVERLETWAPSPTPLPCQKSPLPPLCKGGLGGFEGKGGGKGIRIYWVVKGRNREGRRVLVLWRDMEGLDPAVERRFLEAKLKTEGPFDEMLINGDTATPGIKSLDGLFKRLLEEDER